MNEPDDVVAKAEGLLAGAKIQANVQAILETAVSVGIWLNQWRILMFEGGFSEEWIEDCATVLFHQFFQPFVPDIHGDISDIQSG